ncbi:zinc finger domain-containing protein [archaeon]|nr:zinc finger domain-containing protein [archaeon]
MKKCISCKKEVTDDYVKFNCPNCKKELVRCHNCRKNVIKYKCPECEFTGP